MAKMYLILVSLVGIGAPALAEDLTMRVEQDLMRLGYDTGEANGEVTVDTMIAIAKYQAEHDFAVTGEVSQELAEALSATDRIGNAPNIRSLRRDPGAAVVVSEEGVSAAREACLKDKMIISQSTGMSAMVTNEIKGQLIDQAAQAAIQASGIGMAQQVYSMYSQWASKSESSKSSDAETMAKNLGITEEDVSACQRPAR